MAFPARLEPFKSTIIRRYLAGWSLRALGDEFGVSREAIRLRLIEWGVPRRRNWQQPTFARAGVA